MLLVVPGPNTVFFTRLEQIEPWSLAMTSQNVHELARRPLYTDEQLDLFLSKLPCKPNLNLSGFKQEKHDDELLALTKLQRLAMAFIPWTSVSLHYSTHHTLSLNPTLLFRKIVERQLGGYCMENNTFFSNILRSLGYRCYVAGARISNAEGGATGIEAQGFGGWSHEVILVLIGSKKYLVDVGFGGHGSIEPTLVEEGATAQGVPGVTHHLVRRKLAPFTSDQELWLVEVHIRKEGASGPEDENAAWQPAYCFADQEWLPQDFEITNYRVSRDPRSMFTYRVLVTKTVLDESGEHAIGQRVLINEEATERSRDGKKTILRTCKSEAERVDALARWFDMNLTPEEVDGIRGRVTAIK